MPMASNWGLQQMRRLLLHLTILFGIVQYPQYISAGGRDDCLLKTPDKVITGCTAVIESAREKPGNRAIAYYNRGIAYSARGELDRALVDFTEAVKINSRHAPTFFNRALIYHAKGDLPRAIGDYTAAIELGVPGKLGKIYNNRGTAHYARGQLDLAIADYSRAI